MAKVGHKVLEILAALADTMCKGTGTSSDPHKCRSRRCRPRHGHVFSRQTH